MYFEQKITDEEMLKFMVDGHEANNLYPTREEIAKQFNYNIKTVNKRMKEFEEKGLISDVSLNRYKVNL